MDTYLSAATTIEPKLAGRLGGGRPARNRPVLRGPEPWEFELLRLIAEQGAIPFDQLARFLGADAGQAESVVKHLTEVGYADYGRFLHDEPHWAWLSCRGARLSGTGFRPNRPGSARWRGCGPSTRCASTLQDAPPRRAGSA